MVRDHLDFRCCNARQSFASDMRQSTIMFGLTGELGGAGEGGRAAAKRTSVCKEGEVSYQQGGGITMWHARIIGTSMYNLKP